MQSYPNHRKLSMNSHSPAMSYYSGTESQQSISSKSLYDNVDNELESKDKFVENKSPQYLLPPSGLLRNSLVNRSKSFQEAGPCRIRSNILLRQNLKESNRIDDRFESISNRSSSPVGSTLSESTVNCVQTIPEVGTRVVRPNCSCHERSNGPFFVKILRRLQKLSLQWRKCKKVPRGRSFSNYITFTLTAIFH